MKINIEDYDLVVTLKKGVAHLYEWGKETNGVQNMKLEINSFNLPKVTIDRVVCDEDGNYYLAGGSKAPMIEEEKENV